MAWIGIEDGATGRRARAAGGGAGPLPAGTLLVEAARPVGPEPVSLLRHATEAFALTLRVGPGEAALFLRRGAATAMAAVALPPGRPGEPLRLTLAWEGGRARLAAWWPESQRLAVAACPGAAMSADEGLALLDGPRGPGVAGLALATHAVPAGPWPLIDPRAPVATPDGPVPAARLRAGDVALGPGGAPVRLLWAGSLALPAVGLLAPVEVRAPRLAPGAGLVAAAEQALVIEGGDVEYLFAAERVAVAARDLGAPAATGPVRTWAGLATADGRPVLAAGLAVATLAAAPLWAEPALRAASVLAGLDRPVAPAAPVPRLSAAEARALRFQRAA